MRNLILLIAFLFSSATFGQLYQEKQDTPIINLLVNAGYENGKAGRTISVSSTVTLATGANALQGSTSLRFDASAASQTVTSPLVTVPLALRGGQCQGEVTYLTVEETNEYIYQVLDASGTVIASKTLERAVVMGVPVEQFVVGRVVFDCPTAMRDRVISTGAAVKIDLDSGHLGSVKNLTADEIAETLGYIPANATDYGSVAIENVVPASKGGTGQTTYSTGDQLVGSGTSLVKVASGTQGTVWTMGSSGKPEWAANSGGGGDSGVNLITNNSFEADVTTGWTTSGVTVTRQAFTNGTASDAYYASMTATVSGAYFETSSITIPDNMRGSDIEFGGYHVNALGAWKAEYFVSGTIVASQTLASATTWVQSPTVFAGVASNQTTTKIRYTSLTSGTATLGLNKVYDGSVKSMRTGAIVGPWTNCTVTGTWTTNTTYTCKSRQTGDSKEYEVLVSTSGAPTATQLFINLPSGDVIDLNKTTSPSTAYYNYGLTDVYDSGASHYSGGVGILSSTQILPVVFNAAGTYSIAAGVTQVSPITFGAADTVLVKFKVPIVGLQASGVSFDGRCQTDIQCTNEFTAQVSAAGVVSGENLDWINGNCSLASSTFTCTFNNAVFTLAPNCRVTLNTNPPGGGANPSIVGIPSFSSSSLVYAMTTPGVGNSPFAASISCSKQGVDFVAKKDITGYLSEQNPTASAHTPSNSNFADNTWTTITFGTEVTDRQNMYNPTTGVTTIPRAGAYLINAVASFQIGGYAAGAIFEVEVLVNGTTQYMIDRMYFIHASSPNIVKGSTILRFNANDTVVIRARKSNWGGSSGFQSALETRFSITKVDD